MGNPFQDQLLKAGLVDKNKVKKVKQEKHKKTKQKPAKGTVAVDESKLQAQKAMQAKADKDRELNRLKKEEYERKAITAQIRQLITMNAQKMDDGDVEYNFTDNDVVKKIYINKQLQQQVANGHLTIVRLDDSYELVPSTVAEKIKQRDESYIVVQNKKQSDEIDSDDPYADYQIPDDLMW
jgi:uncharacterized protein YaiL (DUF2058 family)